MSRPIQPFEMRRVRPEIFVSQEQREKRRIAKIKRDARKEEERLDRQKKYEERRAMFKPCPFCGCALAEIPYPGDIYAFVQCPRCSASGPGIQVDCGSDEADSRAIQKWNERATIKLANDPK